MIFIFLLARGAFFLATVSGVFSVWGLAQTFSGIFWFVVAMGAAIEYGKLIAVSYLYRFWVTGPKLLNAYLMVAITSVMLITGAGHYGFLTSGYQTDSLPLKQTTAQIEVLEEERTRLIERKSQIDSQISQLPTDYVKGRERLIRQFRGEQTSTTARIRELDTELLELKKQKITSEAHTGPIVFIAQAFNIDTDKATHYLTLLIIFVFDPLAIALTWAVNVAIRQRRPELPPAPEPVKMVDPEPDIDEHQEPDEDDLPPEEPIVNDVIEEPVENNIALESPGVPAVERDINVVTAPPPASRRRRQYAQFDAGTADIGTLIARYKTLKQKQRANDPSDIFTADDNWDMLAIREVLHKAGVGSYIDD
jgi:hypothetical protein